MGKLQKQKQLEANAIQDGVVRYRKQIRYGVSHSSGDTRFLQSVIGPLAEAICIEQERIIKGKTKCHNYIPLLSLDADKLAFVTLSSILYLWATRGEESPILQTEAARFIGRQCYLERCHDRLQGRSRNIIKLIVGRNNDPSNAQIRAQEYAKTADEDWTATHLDIKIGTQLIDLAIKRIDLLKIEQRIETHQGHPTTPKIIRLNDSFPESLAIPVCLPMIVRPQKWTCLRGGGYLTNPNLDLVKHRNNQHIINALEKADLGSVLTSVNALQETPWRINKRIYSIMRRALKEGKVLGGLPAIHQSHQREQSIKEAPILSKQQVKEVVLSGLENNRSGDRVFAGLLLALETYGTLDSRTVTERITTKLLALKPNASSGRRSLKDSDLFRNRKMLMGLVQYRLYQGFHSSWGLNFLHLERLGLARIEYSNLINVCRKSDKWKENYLLYNSNAEQRKDIALILMDHMRNKLAIDDKFLQRVTQQQLRKQVDRELKKPWVFGKNERFRQATVFVNPDVVALYYINERSLSARSKVGLLLRKGKLWGRAGRISVHEYNQLIQALLQTLREENLLVEVKSIRGISGLQINTKCLRWVLGNDSITAVAQQNFGHSQEGYSDTKGIAARAIMEMRMLYCKKLVRAKSFYFPYQLDYRGRAYPIPQVINPQSDDIGRALIEFATGKCLGERGEYWLKIHLANTYGYDKVSFDRRANWVTKHETQIRDLVDNPLKGGRFWRRADKPWCFLAACEEWVQYFDQGSTFRSHLPIAMDGTCNGLQHLSAMGRDLQGGMATNLVPCKKRKDIYQTVADCLIKRLSEEANSGEWKAKTWLLWLGERQKKDPGIKRKLVKRATMTSPYGVTPYGIREQLIQDGFTAQLKKDELPYISLPERRLIEWIWPGKQDQKIFDLTNYLREKLETCIDEVVVKAKEIKVKLQNLASLLAKADRGISWTTPINFPVVVDHRQYEKGRIRTDLGSLQKDKTESPQVLQKSKQKSTIVPNFIHSFDAAHMMLTVNKLHKERKHHFAMVHDSYGVHACDVDLMHRVLRDEFVRIYREPVLDKFWERQQEAIQEANRNIKLENAPLPGSLNIEDVVYSSYFFS